MAWNKRENWNKSLCNPYRGDNKSTFCRYGKEPNPPLVVPEKPYIVNVKNPRVAPFAQVEFLRTPIDNLHFELYKFAWREEEYLGFGPNTTFTVYKYVAYLPPLVFRTDGYYVLRVRASNDAGYSAWSDGYILDYLPAGSNTCYETETAFMDCDYGFCCSHIYVCT